jgi:hypothetical protein
MPKSFSLLAALLKMKMQSPPGEGNESFPMPHQPQWFVHREQLRMIT